MWILLCSRGYKNTFSSTVRSKPVAYFFQLNHSHTWHFWTVQHESSVFVWELTILRDSGIRQACFSWERNELILLLTRVMTFAGFLITLLADSTKKKFLIIVATTLYHFVLQSVCAISRWCVVQFAGVWIFSFFHAGEFLQSSWSFRQSHPFTCSPSVASPFQLFQCWRGVAEWHWSAQSLFLFFSGSSAALTCVAAPPGPVPCIRRPSPPRSQSPGVQAAASCAACRERRS